MAAAMENDAELMAAVGAARPRARGRDGEGNLAAKVRPRRARGIPPRWTPSSGHHRRPDGIDGHDGIARPEEHLQLRVRRLRGRQRLHLQEQRRLPARVRRPAREARPHRAREPRCPPISMRNRASRTTSGALTRAGRQDDLPPTASRSPEVLAAGRKRIAQALGELMRRLRAVPKPAKATAEPRQASPAPAPATAAAPGAARGRGLSPQPSRLRQRPHRSMRRRSRRPRADDERLRDSSTASAPRSGRTPGRHARAPRRPRQGRPRRSTSRPRPTTSSSSPRDAEREGERSAGDRDLARSAVPRLARHAAAGAACASAAAPVRTTAQPQVASPFFRQPPLPVRETGLRIPKRRRPPIRLPEYQLSVEGGSHAGQ